jgi:hypothetical protein
MMSNRMLARPAENAVGESAGAVSLLMISLRMAPPPRRGPPSKLEMLAAIPRVNFEFKGRPQEPDPGTVSGLEIPR